MNHQRCQRVGRKGQCNYPAVDGSKFCVRHCNEKDRVKGYQLSNPDLKERYEELSAEKALEPLKQEVHLLRTLIEKRLNLAETKADQIIAFNVIHPAMSTLDKLYNSLLKLQVSYSQVLEKSAAEKLAQDIIKIIVEELEDVPGRDNIIDKISARIGKAFVEARNQVE